MSQLLRVLGLGTLLFALVVGVGISGDAKKDKGSSKKPSIPTGWKSLNLTKAQREKVIAIAVDYRAKIATLQKEIDDLRMQERAEQVKVLTEAQKAILLKGLTGESKTPTKEKKTNP